MITAGDVQYEPSQLKVASITDQAILLIAGDYSIHSEAIKATNDHVRRNNTFTPHNIALIYSGALQGIKQRHAEAEFLAPFGLNTEMFLAQQKEMADSFVSLIASQLQDYKGEEVEALVVGTEKDVAHIYHVDTQGKVRCYDDVGFAAIGIGAWHAKSRLMQIRYVNTQTFAPALASIFAAKKAAEIAPGVGVSTDMHMVGRHGVIQIAQWWPGLATILDELYKAYEIDRVALTEKAVQILQGFIDDPKNYQADLTGAARGSAQIDERPSPPAAETPPGHEIEAKNDQDEKET